MRFAAFVAFCLMFSMPAHASDADTLNAMVVLANKGDAEAQYHVGMMYNNGIGTQQDPKQAFEWFQKSTAANDPWEPTSSVVNTPGNSRASSQPTRMPH